jgi:hypothetical protein
METATAANASPPDPRNLDNRAYSADRKRLATSGMAKRRGQTENSEVTNLGTRSDKPESKALR